MKKQWLLFCLIAIAGCAKTNEDIAKDLIQQRLKETLPDYGTYEPVNYTHLGKAFLSYEETDQYMSNKKSLQAITDSLAIKEQSLVRSKSAGNGDSAQVYQKQVQELTDSIKAKKERMSAGKQGYQPLELFKITHNYKTKTLGVEQTAEETFYFDKDFTKIVKVVKVK